MTVNSTTRNSLLIKNVKVFNTEIGSFSEPVHVLIKGGLFTEISEKCSITENQIRVVDGQNKYLIPGLIDCHVHFLSPFNSPNDLHFRLWFTAQIEKNLSSVLRAGVTSIRDMLGPIRLINHFRRKINKGLIQGPRIFASGPMLSVENGYPYFIETESLFQAAIIGRSKLPIHRKADIFPIISRLSKNGINHIKVYRMHNKLLETPEPVADIPLDWLETICDTAHSFNLPVACHHSFIKGFREILDIPIDTLEHLAIDAIYSDEEINRFVKKSIPLIPTLKVIHDAAEEAPIIHPDYVPWLKTNQAEAAFVPQARKLLIELLSDRWNPKYQTIMSKKIAQDGLIIAIKNFKKMLKTNVKMAMGTDSGVQTSFFPNSPRELELMVINGMSNLEALKAGTINGAKVLSKSDKLGSIKVGKWADCVLLDENPLEDISAVRKPRFVVKSGQLTEIIL